MYLTLKVYFFDSEKTLTQERRPSFGLLTSINELSKRESVILFKRRIFVHVWLRILKEDSFLSVFGSRISTVHKI